MKIFKQGRCHYSRLPIEKHVTNSEINQIILRLYRVKAMPDEPPASRVVRKRELEAILKNTQRCLDIIINSPEKHNFSKIPRLDRLVEKTYGLIMDERLKDYDSESNSDMSICESDSENNDRPTVSTRAMEKKTEKRAS